MPGRAAGFVGGGLQANPAAGRLLHCGAAARGRAQQRICGDGIASQQWQASWMNARLPLPLTWLAQSVQYICYKPEQRWVWPTHSADTLECALLLYPARRHMLNEG